MSFAEILTLRKRIAEKKAGSSQEPLKRMTKGEKGRFQREIEERAKDLYSRIGLLKETLDEDFKRCLNLGTDSEQVRWDQMPPMIADCFGPEFELQPEDITGFSISISDFYDSRTPGGSRCIDFRLYRRGHWWSHIGFGVTARSDYYGGNCAINCAADHGQQKEAREARIAFNEFIWGSESTGNKERNKLESSVRSLDLTNTFLNFMVGEMERQTEQT